MGKISERQGEKYKIWTMAVILTGTCISLYYFHVILGIDTIITHIFYVPIILASIWWKRKGLLVALFISGFLIFSHVFLRPDMAIHNDYFRALMFIVTAFVVAELSRRIAKEHEALQAANQQLSADEQQLRAANQQLRADEQQLKAGNQQLRANEQQLVSEVAERKSAEERVRKQREFLRNTIESLGHPFYVIDANDKTIKMANVAAWQGKLPEKLTCYMLSHKQNKPCDGADHPCPLEDIKKTKQPVIAEHIHYDKDGKPRNVEVHCYPVFDNEQNVTQIIEYCLDITERKRAEEALRKERDRVQKYLDVAGVMLVAIDVEERVGLINKRGCEILGYKEEEIIGKNWFDNFLPQRIKHQVRGVFEKLMGSEAEAPEYYENPILTKDGNERRMAWHDTVLRDDKGEVIATLSSGEDITERKRAEEALRRSQKEWENTFNAISDWVVLMDLKGRILRTNRAGEEFVGVPMAQIQGQTCCKLLHGSDTPLPGCPLLKMLQSGRSETMELQLPNSNRWLAITVDPVIDEKGTLAGAVHIARDITERKHAEDEREATIGLLHLINANNQMHELMKVTMVFLKDWSDCEAIGIRLQEGEDFPYFETSGFPEDFIQAENKLCSVNELGEIERDSQGRPFLECMCGNIISGRFDPSKPFFTEHGSFWTNSTTELLAGTTETDRLARTRNRCNTAGYESVALIPLRAGKKTFGLLQFNDKQRGRFTPEKISLLERLADNLAIGLAQRRTDEALRKREELHELFFSQSLDGFFYMMFDEPIRWDDTVDKEKVLDYVFAHHRITKVNDAMLQQYGASREQYIGLTPNDLYAHDIAYGRDVWRDFFDAGRLHLETDERKLDGTPIWIEGDYICLYDSQGRITGHFGIQRDITERKKMVEALGKSEAELFTILNNVPSILIVVDRERRVRRSNKVAVEFGRRTHDEMIGLHGGEALRCLHSLDDPKGCGYGPFCETCVVRNTVLETFKTGKSYYQAEAKLPFEIDGKIKELSLFVSTTTIEISRVPMVLVSLEDITERKKAEELLRLHSEITVNMSEGVYVIRASDGVIVYANPKFEEIFGYDPGEMVGKHVSVVNAPTEKSPEETAKEIMAIINKEGKWQGEIKNVKKDGTPFWCYASVSGFDHPEHGRLLVVVHTDITEQKKAEEKIHNLAKFPSENPNFVLRIAKDGKVLYSNEAGKLLLAKWKSKVGGIMPEKWRNLIAEAFKLEKGKTKEKEEEVKGKIFSLTIAPVKDAGYVNLYANDITERKQAEEKLFDYQAKLKSLASQLSLIEERERHRLATDLHDQIGQALAISKMKLDSLRESVSSGKSTEVLGEVCDCLGQVIQDTRTLTFDLSSPILYELGFEAAVAEWLTEQIQEKYGIKSDFEDDGQTKPLDDDIRVLLFRNVRELLVNVVKHANAKNVKVSIRKVDDRICVSVEDDGVAFDVTEVESMVTKKAKFGLFSIQERLESVGGHFEIESEPGHGSRITMFAPLKSK